MAWFLRVHSALITTIPSMRGPASATPGELAVGCVKARYSMDARDGRPRSTVRYAPPPFSCLCYPFATGCLCPFRTLPRTLRSCRSSTRHTLGAWAMRASGQPLQAFVAASAFRARRSCSRHPLPTVLGSAYKSVPFGFRQYCPGLRMHISCR
jgi:hypothetical protein